MKSKIIIESENIELEDKKLRKEFEKLFSQLQSINERTKGHTIKLHEQDKRIKDLENAK